MPNTFLEDAYRHGAVILPESLKQSAIAAKLIQSYLTADYQADSNSVTLALHIGQPCEPLSKLMKACGSQCALFITACNPRSQPRPPEINDLANQRLRNQLSCHSNYTEVSPF